MKLNQETDILAASPLFRGIDHAQLKLLALMAEARTFLEGEDLMVQGQEGDAAFVLLEGCAAVIIAIGGRETTVAQLGQNDIVGEMALLTDSPRTATVRASGTVRALRVDRATLFRLLAEFPTMSLELLRVITGRLERTTQELARTRAELEEMQSQA
ncbi:MAG: cyclic nucleotide-binding domain-containing protein [Pseudomonadota bacterium]